MLDECNLYLGKLTEIEIEGKLNNQAKASAARSCV